METQPQKLEFVNSQEMHKLHPDTFECPTIEDILKALSEKRELYVKVSIGEERFWVGVISFENGIIKGTVQNDLICTETHGYRFGDSIEFIPENVYNFMFE